jgi:hypothetical protein
MLRFRAKEAEAGCPGPLLLVSAKRITTLFVDQVKVKAKYFEAITGDLFQVSNIVETLV